MPRGSRRPPATPRSATGSVPRIRTLRPSRLLLRSPARGAAHPADPVGSDEDLLVRRRAGRPGELPVERPQPAAVRILLGEPLPHPRRLLDLAPGVQGGAEVLQ